MAIEDIDYKKELENSLSEGRKFDLDFALVDANPEKGYNYPYLVYIPKEPRNILVMECLNNYENEMQGIIDNPEGMEEVYKLFREQERIVHVNQISKEANLEPKEKSIQRIFERTEKGMRTLSKLIDIFNFQAPAIVPLIPGFNSGEELNKVKSQLDKDVIVEVAPQIKAMIEDAKKIIQRRSGIVLNDRVLPVGHSKSSTFANNFVAYYPEMCEAAILLGREFSTLPIDEIALQIVDEDKISDDEQFQIVDGKVTKKITSSDFEKITQEYEKERRSYQTEITANPNGTYNLPLNFPVGIADIEQYRDLSNYPGGKEEYRQALVNMQRMVGIGEKEETVPGHFAYSDATTLEGIKIKAGQDISPVRDNLGRDLFEVEQASMHNRVLEYIDSIRILFGKSTNEKLRNYSQLCKVLGMPVQSKIYKGVGHADFSYSQATIKELTGISSRGIYASKALKSDMKHYYEEIDIGKAPILGDTDKAERVSPVPQLIRRFLVSNSFSEFMAKRHLLQDLPEEYFMEIIEKHIFPIPKGANLDRIFDRLTTKELESICSMELENKSEKKSGFADVILDNKIRPNGIQEATTTINQLLKGPELGKETSGKTMYD